LLGQIGDVFGQPIDVDDMRVEVVGEPFLELAVTLVARVCDGLKRLTIAPRWAVSDRSEKITFAEMREQGVRGLLIYCSDYRCSRSIAASGDPWPGAFRSRAAVRMLRPRQARCRCAPLRGRPDGIFVNPFETGSIGPDLFWAACRMGLEGLVSKRADRPYRGGRSKDWIKIKNRQHQGFDRVKENYARAT
jgi:hypothetical protein